MIRVTCSKCMAAFNVEDKHAGKTAKCRNCGNTLPIPLPSAPAAAPVSPTPVAVGPGAAVAGTPTVVVQVQTQTATDTIGSANKSFAAVVLLWLIPVAGLPYFYLGQTGKGIIVLLVDLLCLGPIVIFSCGVGLIISIPVHILWLIDQLIVTGRIRKGPVSRWRCF